MQDPQSVMTQAFDGYVGEIALEIGVSDKRIYELLGKDNPYPKLWRLLNALGRLNYEQLLLVQADFNARVLRLNPQPKTAPRLADLHRETGEAIQAILDKMPLAEKKREIREAIAELQKNLDALND